MAAPALVQALAHIRVWVQQQSISRVVVWDPGNISKIFELFTQSLTADAPGASSMPSMEPTISLSSLQALQALGLVSACAITGIVRSYHLYSCSQAFPASVSRHVI